jgi:hypothetical protein
MSVKSRASDPDYENLIGPKRVETLHQARLVRIDARDPEVLEYAVAPDRMERRALDLQGPIANSTRRPPDVREAEPPRDGLRVG